MCADFLDLVKTGQELRLWGNFSKCDKKDLRKYVESDFEYGISKFEERFVVFRDPKYKDVGVMVGQASMALTMEKVTMTEYETIVLEVVTTIPGNAQPVFSTPSASS